MQRVVKLPLSFFLLPNGGEQADKIYRQRRAKRPDIAPGIPVAAVVRHKQILQQRNTTAEKRQYHNDRLCRFLGGCLFLFLQLLELAAGQPR